MRIRHGGAKNRPSAEQKNCVQDRLIKPCNHRRKPMIFLMIPVIFVLAIGLLLEACEEL